MHMYNEYDAMLYLYSSHASTMKNVGFLKVSHELFKTTIYLL